MYGPRQQCCEDCQDIVFEEEFSGRYHDNTGRWVCLDCMLNLIERCIIHLVSHKDYTEIWIEFNDEIFTEFCNTTEILSETIQSHGYIVKETGGGWVAIDIGDAIIMKIGNASNGVDSIRESVMHRVWETYV